MSRRDQIRMSDDEVEAFLREPGQVLNVASSRRDGSIDLVAMWYGFTDDGAVAFTTFAKSQKVVNWRRDPRFTALVEGGDRYAELRGVELVGTVELVSEPDDVVAIVRSVAPRYAPPPSARPASADQETGDADNTRRIAAKRVGVVLRPTRTISWDHRKLGGTY
jgi:hypothetical protein